MTRRDVLDELDRFKHLLGTSHKLFSLVKRSICTCGFPAIDPIIPDGKIYLVDVSKVKRVEWICGGCRKNFMIECYYAADYIVFGSVEFTLIPKDTIEERVQ